MRSPIRSKVETFKLGSRTNAINATHKAIPMKSMRTQLPVNTQMHTTVTDSIKLNNSAAVNLPQNPKEILLPSVQGRIMYWHIGRSKKASAIVAITVKRKVKLKHFIFKYLKLNSYLLCRQWKAFASNRRRRTSREVRLTLLEVGRGRGLRPGWQILNRLWEEIYQYLWKNKQIVNLRNQQNLTYLK